MKLSNSPTQEGKNCNHETIMEKMAILKEWFDRVDSDKTGSITAIQLKSVFAIGNLEFPISVVEQMIRMYDFDRNGTMSFDEFAELNKFLQKIQNVFSDLERGRGFLMPDDVYEALTRIGFSLDSPAFYTVCENMKLLVVFPYFLMGIHLWSVWFKSYKMTKSFDKAKNGKFKLDDFISLCIFVQSARNLFNSFDTSKQGRISLDFNQFCYCKYEIGISYVILGATIFCDISCKPESD